MKAAALFRTVAFGAMLVAGTAGVRSAVAADLTMGIAVETDTIDPHFHWFGGSLALSFQMFEPLIWLADDGSLQPMLASSWRTIDPETWEFNLRPGVKFQDGSPLTAADVAFTLKRAPDVPQSPNSFAPFLRDITKVETPDPSRVVIHTNGPVPLFPNFISRIGIISEHVGLNATTQDYNTGKAAIGTGPYQFVSWTRGDSVRLKRNDAYWGTKAPWENVRIRYIPNAASRLASLRSGDVDVIDGVSVEDVETVKQNKDFRVRESLSSNVIGLQVDVTKRKPPFISGPNGEELAVNPLSDLRVRQAIAMAISRDALKDRVMNGEVDIAYQVMAPGQYGFDPDLKPIAYDPVKAKQLLADAGFPNGFRMTLQCQADRYPKGPSICQALAQMLVRIGIKTDPQPTARSMFVEQANAHTYSLFDIFFIIDTGEPSSPLIHTFATEGSGPKGTGQTNRGRYSNPEFDKLLFAANNEVDAAKREATLRQATALLINDVGFIPLMRPLNIEAMRNTLEHTRTTGDFVFAADIHPATAQR